MKETQKKPKEKQLLDHDTVSRKVNPVHHYLKESFLILQSQKHM